jgi:hypothetical protein
VRRRGQEERAEQRRDDTAQIRQKTVFRSTRLQCGQDALTVKHAWIEVQLKKLMDVIRCRWFVVGRQSSGALDDEAALEVRRSSVFGWTGGDARRSIVTNDAWVAFISCDGRGRPPRQPARPRRYIRKMPALLSARCRRYRKMLARQLESYAASVLVAAHRGWDASFASLFLHVLECLLRVVERLLFRGNLVFVLAVFLVP